MKAKNSTQNILSGFIFFTSCMTSPLMATETAETPTTVTNSGQNQVSRCPYGKRALSTEERQCIQKSRIDADKAERPEESTQKKIKKPYKKGKAKKGLTSKGIGIYGENYSYKNQHTINDASTKGLTLEIEDGSIFAIADSDQWKVSKWQKGAPISILPNHSWNSNEYIINNCDTGARAAAKLSQGPLFERHQTRYVSYINTATGEVLLDNGSLYKIASTLADRSQFSKWQSGDNIITGENDAWWSNGYTYILINVATDSYVIASRIQ
ncbi:MAG: hypothetical protein JWO53_813 [Chlamydiia bacterium]|nr:hypothetical protein [Chlamydiia bacterium]